MHLNLLNTIHLLHSRVTLTNTILFITIFIYLFFYFYYYFFKFIFFCEHSGHGRLPLSSQVLAYRTLGMLRYTALVHAAPRRTTCILAHALTVS